MRRISGRRVCPTNGRVYHVEHDPPKHDGVCDQSTAPADPARRRQARDGPQAPRGLPRADLAADRLLRGRAACCAASTARAARPRSTTTSARRSRRCARRRSEERGRRAVPCRADVIIKKTPAEIDKMAAAGADPRAHDATCCEGKVREGVTTRELDRGRRALHPLAGRDAGVQGLPRLPGLDLRVAELDGRPRHPRPLPLERGDIISIDIGVDPRRLGRRRRAHVPGRPGHPGRRASCSRSRGRRCSTPSSSARRQPPRRRLATPCRSGSRRTGFSVVRSLVGHGVGPRDARGPAGPQLRRAGPRPAARGGHGPRDRADGQRRAPHGADGRRRLGDLLPGRLAGGPLRVHGRDHRRRAADPHSVARARGVAAADGPRRGSATTAGSATCCPVARARARRLVRTSATGSGSLMRQPEPRRRIIRRKGS